MVFFIHTNIHTDTFMSLFLDNLGGPFSGVLSDFYLNQAELCKDAHWQTVGIEEDAMQKGMHWWIGEQRHYRKKMIWFACGTLPPSVVRGYRSMSVVDASL